MNAFDEYNSYLDLHKDYIHPMKKKVDNIIKNKRLVSCMNNTKWIELQSEIYSLPFPPAFQLRCVTDNENNDDSFKHNVVPHYIGDWSSYWNEGLPPFFSIEWIKVIPQYAKFRGRLIEPEILDETVAFERLLNKLNIPYEKQGSVFTIWGYR